MAKKTKQESDISEKAMLAAAAVVRLVDGHQNKEQSVHVLKSLLADCGLELKQVTHVDATASC